MDIIEEKKNKSEEQLVEKIREGNQQAFERLFFEYFFDLCSYALQITKSNEQAKDVVQEVFYKIWKRRRNWSVYTSIKAYLFRSVRNEALNLINKRGRREKLKEQLSDTTEKYTSKQSTQKNEGDEKLIKAVWNVVKEMPQRRRSVFVLHRKHGLSYKEIAEVLDITRKTVENHMGLALDDIRGSIDIE
ncbi:RNA polymerase sigma-70 factor [Fodinibius halophilus]|uniref:RNA polymerase sigma-70 factor n=1 Tax=Fodinibius halophilus TaxID=1736908 RepID=A0A6M1TBT6_9BACT|nr:RNA polymerase sigma-70 factor [Fodinibius halophilus]NGP89813.1 RNA polymerase sigma-70 factor [Fodinibius halophilus]